MKNASCYIILFPINSQLLIPMRQVGQKTLLIYVRLPNLSIKVSDFALNAHKTVTQCHPKAIPTWCET